MVAVLAFDQQNTGSFIISFAAVLALPRGSVRTPMPGCATDCCQPIASIFSIGDPDVSGHCISAEARPALIKPTLHSLRVINEPVLYCIVRRGQRQPFELEYNATCHTFRLDDRSAGHRGASVNCAVLQNDDDQDEQRCCYQFCTGHRSWLSHFGDTFNFRLRTKL